MTQNRIAGKLIALAFVMVCLCSPSLADDKKAKTSKPKLDPRLAGASKKFAGLKVPEKGVKELKEFIRQVQLNRPRTLEEYVVLSLKIRAAAKRIVQQADAKSVDARVAQSQMNVMLPNVIGYLSKSERNKEIRAFTKAMSKKKVTRRDIRPCLMIGRSLEAGAPKSAALFYESVAGLFAKSTSTAVAASAHMFRGALARVKLLNASPLSMTGTKLDGSKFDLKKLRGKVVLIDFWATWCGPCRAEFPNMRKLYTKYKDKGFEIVGVSIDQDREALENYQEKNKLPWLIVHDNGGKHPAVEKYGIVAIPQMMFVNRKGVVTSLSARGKQLEKLLEKEFK